ncbi:MAG: cytochrome c oxidase assembly protein [Proteobacteria bacterium]|nr:cytochrome c oxidase assembly protein [Pseudomonadota bacterium]
MRKHLTLLTLVILGMFGFCFALVPLYSVFCKATGLNGKTSGMVEKVSGDVDASRTITVILLATLNDSLPDKENEFNTKVRKYTVHPGEYIKTSFWVKNLKDTPKIVQAIPSVSPGLVAKHVKKLECFCFQHQPLAAHEGKELPLVFAVDPKLPADIKTVTLAYTLFEVTQN